jgi:hypothetical protein
MQIWFIILASWPEPDGPSRREERAKLMMAGSTLA